jgi:hypothetical protein
MRIAVPTLLAAMLVAAAAGPALADPPSMTLPSEPPPPPAPLHPKSETTAQMYSIGGALLGPLLTMIGSSINDSNDGASGVLVLTGGVISILGPTAGHWYAGKTVTAGLGLRLAGLVAAGIGIVMLLDCDGDTCDESPNAALVLIAAAGSYLIGTIWDVVTADDSARAWNRRHAEIRF